MRIPLAMTRLPLIFAVAALTPLFLITPPATAQAVCGLRTALLDQLQGKYCESPISMGLASNGSVIEITRSENGSWSILQTNPSGVTCLMAAGEHWENIKPKAAEFNPS